MANFLINSTNTKALRKADVSSLEIVERTVGEETTYDIVVRLTTSCFKEIIFETGETLENVETLATDIITALET